MLSLGKSAYWKNVRPGAAIADLRTVYQQAGRNRWRIALASMAVTGTLFWALTHESWLIPPPKPQVIFINSWPADRTKAETEAFLKKNQALLDSIKSAEDRQIEESKELYRQLGRATGVDVDAMEKKAKADAEAAAKAKAATAAGPGAVAPR